MVTRRSVLGASASGALAAIAGCVDAIPVIGAGSADAEPPADIVESTESFLADPRLESVLKPVPASATTGVHITAYDGSIADHAAELSVEESLSNFGVQAILPQAGDDAIESTDFVLGVQHKATWSFEDPEGDDLLYGVVEGYTAHHRGEYDREAFETALELSDSPAGSTSGYDLYTDRRQRLGLDDDGIVTALLPVLKLPEKRADSSTYIAGETAILERAAARSTSAKSTAEWVQSLVDAVSPAHFMQLDRTDHSSGEGDVLHARSFHVDGARTTVTLAEGTSDVAQLTDGDWTDGEAEENILFTIATMTGKSRQTLDPIRELVVEGPTVAVDEHRGVVSAVIPSEEVTVPHIA